MARTPKSLSEGLSEFYAAQAATPPASTGCSLTTFKPMRSKALSVHPDQIPEAREHARKHGLNIDFHPSGDPVITSSRQFRRYAKLCGFFHKGYAVLAALLLAGSAVAEPQLAPAPGAFRQPPAAESPEPALADEPLTPAEERLFGRFRARIDKRVDERLVDAVEEAGSNRGIGGSVLAAALLRLVKTVVNALIVAVVTAVVIDLLWKYGLVIGLLFMLAVAVIAVPAGWLGGRRGGAGRAS